MAHVQQELGCYGTADAVPSTCRRTARPIRVRGRCRSDSEHAEAHVPHRAATTSPSLTKVSRPPHSTTHHLCTVTGGGAAAGGAVWRCVPPADREQKDGVDRPCAGISYSASANACEPDRDGATGRCNGMQQVRPSAIPPPLLPPPPMIAMRCRARPASCVGAASPGLRRAPTYLLAPLDPPTHARTPPTTPRARRPDRGARRCAEAR